MVGVPARWDSADIENWISPFVVPSLIYEVHYVGVQGRDVLMLIVNPPKQGDPIFALQKGTGDDGGHLREGTIYVRHGGKTEQHKPADLEMLTRRAQATATDLQLEVVADSSGMVPMSKEMVSDEFRDKYLANRRKKLFDVVPSPPADRYLAPTRSYGETRTSEQFTEEVDRFVAQAKKSWLILSTFKFIEAGPPQLRLSVMNHTDDNFEDVAVELTLPLHRIFVHLDKDDAYATLDPVEEPTRWGGTLASALGVNPLVPVVHQAGSTPTIARAGEKRTRVRFPPFHAYPQTPFRLPSIVVVPPPPWEGREMRIDWSATAKNTKGKITGTAVATVPGSTETEHEGEANDQGESASAA